MRTCNEQCVHARRRLRGLEHFGDVLLGQRGLASALALGVLLLPPLEVLGREKQEKTGEKERMDKYSSSGEREEQRNSDCGRERKGGLERGVLRADRDGVICGGLTVGKSARCWVSGEPKSLVNLEGWSRE